MMIDRVVHGSTTKRASDLSEGDILLSYLPIAAASDDPPVVQVVRPDRDGRVIVEFVDGRWMPMDADLDMTCSLYVEKPASELRVGDMLDLQGDPIVDPDDDHPEFANHLALVEEIEVLEDGSVTVHFDTCSAEFPAGHALRWNRRDTSFDDLEPTLDVDQLPPAPMPTGNI